MPKSVLTRKRSLIARIAIFAMVFSLMAVALPASAHSVAIDTTGPCPAATPSAGFTDIGGLDADHTDSNQLLVCVWDHDGNQCNYIFAQ